MATRFLDKKTHRFSFVNDDGDSKSLVLIFGDEVDAPANATGADPEQVTYRGRPGTWTRPPLKTSGVTEMYFLDVGQGDAAFVVTPNRTKVLVDGGLRRRALGFLIWKYRLDQPANSVTIDHLIVSHGDKDHVEGLIPLLQHPQITVTNIHHNGIGVFNSGHFNSTIGDEVAGSLVTTHDTTADLAGLPLADSSSAVFKDWVDQVVASGANYGRADSTTGQLDIEDPAIDLTVVGPVRNPDGSYRWMSTKSETINGNSLTFHLQHGIVRAFFSGDLNKPGSRRLLETPGAAARLSAHVFKAPHHGSHEFDPDLLLAVNPQFTVISSGEVPDHGHPRANFLAAAGKASRSDEPLLFSTELAALFKDAGDAAADAATVDTDDLEDDSLDFSTSAGNVEARRRFKKSLPGIVNIRTDGTHLYAYRRVQQSYGWESYGPIAPTAPGT